MKTLELVSFSRKLYVTSNITPTIRVSQETDGTHRGVTEREWWRAYYRGLARVKGTSEGPHSKYLETSKSGQGGEVLFWNPLALWLCKRSPLQEQSHCQLAGQRQHGGGREKMLPPSLHRWCLLLATPEGKVAQGMEFIEVGVQGTEQGREGQRRIRGEMSISR